MGPTLNPEKLTSIGWYMMTGQVSLCPECGAYRGGTPGYYWHVVRENTDDREKIKSAHGEEYVIMGALKENTDHADGAGQGAEDGQQEHPGVSWRGDLPEDEEEVREEESGQASGSSVPGHSPEKQKVDISQRISHAFLSWYQGDDHGYIEIGIPPGWHLVRYHPPCDRLGRFPRLEVRRSG